MDSNQTKPNNGGHSMLLDADLMTEFEATIAELKRANARLEQQVTDDAIELQATIDEYNRVKEEIEQAKEDTERAKEAAERANSVKSAFLASMSHELRTPLNAIINFTRFVAKGAMGPLNAEQEETLNEVIDSAKHLLNLINDVLDMSKIEAGSLKLFIEDDIDLNPILSTVVTTGKGLIGDKTVDFQADIPDDLPKIRGDRQRIVQILLNIVSNACKFTQQGHIKIRVYQEADEVMFVVEDTGPGIAPEDQAAVFQAFKQTTTGLRQAGGTGLGMPISKNLVEAHHGRMWLESKLGTGSTFYVALPLKSDDLTPSIVA